MKGSALCHGAATIITGFATGNGAAYGIGLENKTEVELTGSGELVSLVNGKPEGSKLAEAAVKRTLEIFDMSFDGAKVSTETNIPMAAGLKSSSVAANAIVLSTLGAITRERGEIRSEKLAKGLRNQRIFVDGDEVSEIDLINIGIDAAFDAKVTATGALDDASASFFGGYTVTRNLDREIVKRGGMEDLSVVIYLPEGKSFSGDISPDSVKAFRKEVGLLWDQARAGRVYDCITLNGMIHSVAFGYGMAPTLLALEAGAIACGLSGTGPAVVALARDGAEAVVESWDSLEGKVIQTRTNNTKAQVML